MGNSIYRFFSFNENSFDSLNEKYLYFSKLNDFNDPFEGKSINMLRKPSIEDFSDKDFITLQRYLAEIKKTPKINENLTMLYVQEGIEGVNRCKERVISDFYNIFVEGFKLLDEDYFCCFSQDRVDSDGGIIKALKNKLMWSHYAHGMRGFCIEFDGDKLVESLYRKNDQVVGMMPISYDDFKKVNVIECAVELMNCDKRNLPLRSQASYAITIKSKEWMYENEFRLQLKHKFGYFDADCIKSITIGFKAREEDKREILSIFSSENIAFQQAQLANDSFDIELTPLSIM